MDSLKYKSVFDIIGPVMVGPSSSHTAGAARIGKIVRSIFGEQPDELEIHLYESFAKTYRGHGTDVAIVAGVLGMDPDDERLPEAPRIAHEQGMTVSYVPHLDEQADHPNTARLIVRKGERHMAITGISIGGGSIQVKELNGFDISLNMGMPTFILIYNDRPGILAQVGEILKERDINVAQMTVTRVAKGGETVMVLEVDTSEISDAVEELKKLPQFHDVNFFM